MVLLLLLFFIKLFDFLEDIIITQELGQSNHFERPLWRLESLLNQILSLHTFKCNMYLLNAFLKFLRFYLCFEFLSFFYFICINLDAIQTQFFWVFKPK